MIAIAIAQVLDHLPEKSKLLGEKTLRVVNHRDKNRFLALVPANKVAKACRQHLRVKTLCITREDEPRPAVQVTEVFLNQVPCARQAGLGADASRVP